MIYRNLDQLWIDGVNCSNKKGLNLEFGVYKGYSLNTLAKIDPSLKWYGFDSFDGLPEKWNDLPKGYFKCKPPKCESNVELIIGLFQDTLVPFLNTHKENVSIIHIDSDIYSSCKYVLNTLKDRIVSGTIIIFDELGGYSDYKEHEYKAFKEFISENDLKYECLGYHVSHMQYLVKML